MTTTSTTALITGATSGIGLAVARDLGRCGHRVFVCARTARDVTRTVDELREEGIEAAGTDADVRCRKSVARLVGVAVETFGPLGILVNSAGRSGGGPLAGIDDDLWYDVIDTNLNGVFLVTREVLRNGLMTQAPFGRIVSIASTAGKQGVLLGSPYAASKHGVVGFTRALGKELAPSAVTVNAVCPGHVETPMAQRVRQGYAAAWDATEEFVQEQFEAKIPLGRYATAEEVAGLVGYLTTPGAAYITGQALNVCGGMATF